jgi:hypothetical protein
MKGLPVWMLACLAALAALLTFLGFEERHEISILPMLVGALWLLFTLASLGAGLRGAIAPDAE